MPARCQHATMAPGATPSPSMRWQIVAVGITWLALGRCEPSGPVGDGFADGAPRIGSPPPPTPTESETSPYSFRRNGLEFPGYFHPSSVAFAGAASTSTVTSTPSGRGTARGGVVHASSTATVPQVTKERWAKGGQPPTRRRLGEGTTTAPSQEIKTRGSSRALPTATLAVTGGPRPWIGRGQRTRLRLRPARRRRPDGAGSRRRGVQGVPRDTHALRGPRDTHL